MASKVAVPNASASPLLKSPPSLIAGRTAIEIWLTLAAVLLPLIPLIITLRRRRTQQRNQKPFPFLELPQELRDMVYEYFLDDPVYPAPTQQSCNTTSAVPTWMRPGRWTLTAPSTASTSRQGSKWIFLANKQIYTEYMDMLCKRRTFCFNVSPQTYTPDDTTIATTSLATSSSSSSASAPASLPQIPQDASVWNISPATLSKIHHCSLKLITASSMLGVTDPRSMTSSSWTLGRRMREQLKHMSSTQSFTLDAKALGDPLWNPLWIWYHASQSLKLLGTDMSDTVPRGPQLTEIRFSLDTWSPGENFLKRVPDQGWTWFCIKEHVVAMDSGYEMTVREFCAKLYKDCRICRQSRGEEYEDEELL